MHLVIPFASTTSQAGQWAIQQLQLPNLQTLLLRLKATERNEGDEYQLSPPHERELARLAGWGAGDGKLPWAAQRAQLDGIDTGDLVWGMLSPAHWHVGPDHITMLDPDLLELSAGDSRALMDAVAPLFRDEGWLLAWGAPTRWYVAHESLQDLPTASLDRVIGRNPDLWMPDHPNARALRRLQSEVQMLLHDHPVNQRRAVASKLSVNTVWLSGCGMRQPARGHAAAVIDDLRAPLLREEWEDWIEAWRVIDGAVLSQAVKRVKNGEPVTLHLCGERHAQCFEIPRLGLLHRVAHPRSRLTVNEALKSL
jgi:hypothetical protein